MLRDFSHFFRIVHAFFGFPHSFWLLLSIFLVFSWFFFWFSSIWGGFREDFSTIFDMFSKTCPNMWKSTKHCVGAWILKVGSLKNKQILPQNCKETCRFAIRTKQAPKLLKNLNWKGLGLHLGRVWEALGRLGATLGRILTVCWTSKSYLFKTLVQHGLQEAFWIDFGKGWGGFGYVLGEYGLSTLKLLRHMVIPWALWVSPAASHFATGTPALLRLAERQKYFEI